MFGNGDRRDTRWNSIKRKPEKVKRKVKPPKLPTPPTEHVRFQFSGTITIKGDKSWMVGIKG